MSANVMLADATHRVLTVVLWSSHWLLPVVMLVWLMVGVMHRRRGWLRRVPLLVLALVWWRWDRWDGVLADGLSAWVRLHPIMFTCGLILAAGLSFMLGVVLMVWDAGRPVEEEKPCDGSDLPPSFAPSRRPPAIRPTGGRDA